ncbi:MAG: hypothetical protein CMJ32_03925 [Phycisphaerae bacterium]|nr:hypothetical protein [Phycisphaerae bacterium]
MIDRTEYPPVYTGFMVNWLLCSSLVLLSSAGDPVRQQEAITSLLEATELERKTVRSFVHGESWTHRAMGALRLCKYECEQADTLVMQLLDDRDWHVRCFAVLAMARRGMEPPAGFLMEEEEPRVVRTALRCGYGFPKERIQHGIEGLYKYGSLDLKLLGAEIALASGIEQLQPDAEKTIRTVILRMDDAEAGGLSPRLAAVTSGNDVRRAFRWRHWAKRNRGDMGLDPAHLANPETPGSPTWIESLDEEAFSSLHEYMEQLEDRYVDLGICLDCTASMSGELAQAQGGIDDLMSFIGDVTAGIRIAVVAYRDNKDTFKTKGWDFTSSISQARSWLWTLSAEGGGDRPEAVADAMRLACGKLSWNRGNSMTLIIIGDAPPKVGTGSHCVRMARQAAEHDLHTHVISCTRASGEQSGDDEVPGLPVASKAEGRVEFFHEIAEAGGGRCVQLGDNALIGEITGLTLGDLFRREIDEFFNLWQMLCR